MRTDATQHSLKFGARRINYALYRADRKQLRVVVEPDMTVEVIAPRKATAQAIKEAVMKKAAWIARKLDHVESFHPLPAPRKYVSGETIVYLGRQYRLKVVKGASAPARLRGRYLWAYVARKDRETVKHAVDTWYATRAHDAFKRYAEKCMAIASRHGVPEPTIVIRAMRRRWGSCAPSGRITLNTQLVEAPAHCIEYVIMHELCHLKHHNHSKAFYSLLTRCQPNWRHRKQTLDRIRPMTV